MSDPAVNSPEVHHNEEVLWTGRRSQWFYLGHWLLGLVFTAAVAAGMYYYQARFHPAWWHPWIYAVAVLPVLAVAITVAVARSGRRYRITKRRIISETGRVVRDSNELRVQDIRSINVLKSGFTGFLGIGRVEFSSAAADDADVIFYEISGADRVRDLVRHLQN